LDVTDVPSLISKKVQLLNDDQCEIVYVWQWEQCGWYTSITYIRRMCIISRCKCHRMTIFICARSSANKRTNRDQQSTKSFTLRDKRVNIVGKQKWDSIDSIGSTRLVSHVHLFVNEQRRENTISLSLSLVDTHYLNAHELHLSVTNGDSSITVLHVILWMSMLYSILKQETDRRHTQTSKRA
jgi:hypothetical protein